MKKLLFLLIGLMLVGAGINAQDGKKNYKKANRLLGTYNLDPGSNADKLEEAKTLIDAALEDEEVQAMAKAWTLKGKIYNELIGAEMNQKILDPAYKVKNLDAVYVAYDALRKAFELAEKKFEKKEVFTALKASAGHISNGAITTFQEKDYENAFKNFGLSIELNDFFVENGEEPSFVDPAAYNDQVFYTCISGFYTGKYDEVMPYFKKAMELEVSEPFIYEGMYNMLKDSDGEKALKYLQDGRAKFPDDNGLLYAEINYMVSKGQLEQLISKLEEAAEKDPNNISVFTTLGSVFDNLSTQSAADGNVEKSEEYFGKALEWFEKALEIDENSFDAYYSIGALYYNKAASYTDALNEFANDFSVEGNKKYDALKEKMDGLFDTAFPYFEKAEQLKPDDLNTIIAIKEIYARKGDLEKSNEYKAKLEALQNG